MDSGEGRNDEEGVGAGFYPAQSGVSQISSRKPEQPCMVTRSSKPKSVYLWTGGLKTRAYGIWRFGERFAGITGTYSTGVVDQLMLA